MRSGSRAVRDGQGEIAFQVVRRSSRKRLALVVLATGAIEVRAPLFVTNEQIDEFVRANADVVRERLEAVRSTAPAATRYETGDTLLYLGRETALRIVEAAGRPRAELRDGHLQVTVPAGLDEALRHRVIRECILDWLAQRTLELARGRMQDVAERVGLQPVKVTVKQMRSRWGSCSSRGSMSLNARLAMAPPEVFEYVLVHECCHLRHPDHSKRFWDLMGELLPGYEAARAWLKQNGLRMWI